MQECLQDPFDFVRHVTVLVMLRLATVFSIFFHEYMHLTAGKLRPVHTMPDQPIHLLSYFVKPNVPCRVTRIGQPVFLTIILPSPSFLHRESDILISWSTYTQSNLKTQCMDSSILAGNATCNVPLTVWIRALIPFSGWPLLGILPHVQVTDRFLAACLLCGMKLDGRSKQHEQLIETFRSVCLNRVSQTRGKLPSSTPASPRRSSWRPSPFAIIMTWAETKSC